MLVVGADVIVKHNRRHGGSIMLNATNGGVLTEQEMRYFKVIEAPNNDSFQIASYDLRLGTCHYVFDNSQDRSDSKWSLIHIGSDRELDNLNQKNSYQKYTVPEQMRHTLTIPPYGSAILELKETVDTYTAAAKYKTLIVGRFDLKLSRVYQALISQQATQVEPFYQGKLYCFVHNLCNKPININENDEVATIEFTYAGKRLTDEDFERIIDKYKLANLKYEKSEYSSKYRRGIGEVRWFYEQNRLPSDCGLNHLYTEVEQKVTQASEGFNTQFNIYFEREDTLSKIADRVNNRIESQRKSLETLVAVITGVVSLGVGSLIWMFYQDLIKVMQAQEMYTNYLMEEDATRIIIQSTTLFSSYPWLLPYAYLIITLIMGAVGIYYHHKKSSK